jgi:ribosomal protein S18 acetylase RimI-like enzyme
MRATIDRPLHNRSALCAPILRSLPAWFGIEDAITRYVAAIDQLPTLLAYYKGSLVGFLTLKPHNPTSAEVYVMAVKPEWHRQGIGRSLIRHAIEWGREFDYEYLQVKTLGPSHPDAGYARTRAFYWAMGFRPLEEFTQIWNEQNPCLLMVRKLDWKYIPLDEFDEPRRDQTIPVGI